jgi:hypothetical protein
MGEMLCCEWCGDEFSPKQMARLGLCIQCEDVADEVSEDALLPVPDALTPKDDAGGR